MKENDKKGAYEVNYPPTELEEDGLLNDHMNFQTRK